MSTTIIDLEATNSTSDGISENDTFWSRDLHEYFEIRRQFNQFHRYFVSWIIPVYFVVGLVGTILCLIVLIRTKRRKYTPQISHWFIALSLSDVYVLVLGLLLMYVTRLHYFMDVKDAIEPRRWNAFSCYCINTLIYFGLLFSTWVQAGISLLRALSTCMPLTVRVHLSSSRSLICLSVTAGTCLLTAFLMIRLGMRYTSSGSPPVWRCSLQANGASQAFFYVSLIIKVVLPWILLVLASISILCSLVRYRRSFADSISFSTATTTRTHESTAQRHTQSEQWSNTSSIHRRIRRNNQASTRTNQDVYKESQRHRLDSSNRQRFQQKRISYVLLGMNLSFLCFNLPFEVWKIYYERNHAVEGAAPLIINIFLNILVYTNNATNWLFYFMLGRRFRGQVRRLLASMFVCGDRAGRHGSQRYKRRSGQHLTPTAMAVAAAARTQRPSRMRRLEEAAPEPAEIPNQEQEDKSHVPLIKTNIVVRLSNGTEL